MRVNCNITARVHTRTRVRVALRYAVQVVDLAPTGAAGEGAIYRWYCVAVGSVPNTSCGGRLTPYFLYHED